LKAAKLTHLIFSLTSVKIRLVKAGGCGVVTKTTFAPKLTPQNSSSQNKTAREM